MSTTVTIYPAADAYVDVANPTTNYGAANYLLVEDVGIRAWVRFLTSSIPAGKVILHAKLKVNSYYGGIKEINIQRCSNISWGENTITYNNAPDSDMIADEILFYSGYGASSGVQEYDITKQFIAAMAAGSICYRMKFDLAGTYENHARFTAKEYTATECCQIEVTYADSGTVAGFIDVPLLDGYVYGTYSYEDPPNRRGFSVATGSVTLPTGMSSSSGREVEQTMLIADTSTSNLRALGLPIGATIARAGGLPKRELRMFLRQGWSGEAVCSDLYLYGSATGALGTTITTDDFDCPGCTSLGNKSSDCFVTGWKIWNVDAIGHNTGGVTNYGLVPGSAGTYGGLVLFSANENVDENAPVLRIYYEYNLFIKLLNETITIAQSFINGLKRVLTESLSLTQLFSRSVIRIILNTVSITEDLLAKIRSRMLVESVMIVETFSNGIQKTLSETITIVGGIIRWLWRRLDESIALVSNVSKGVSLVWKVMVYVDETINRSFSRVYGEVMFVVESFIRGRVFTDALMVADSFFKTLQYLRSFIEEIRVPDAVVRSISTAKSEILTLGESLSRGRLKVLIEAISLTGTILRGFSRTLVDLVKPVVSFRQHFNGLLTGQWVRRPKDTNNEDWRKQAKDL